MGSQKEDTDDDVVGSPKEGLDIMSKNEVVRRGRAMRRSRFKLFI
jgi:hypothetical protein